MLRQRSFSRKKSSIPGASVSWSLNSLLENLLFSLSLVKEQIESVDDELFKLQTFSTVALLPVTSQLSSLCRVNELHSFSVYACQKKVEELSVFAGYVKIEEQVLEPGVRRSSAVSVPEELTVFLREAVLGSPVFRDLILEIHPQSAQMLRLICDPEVRSIYFPDSFFPPFKFRLFHSLICVAWSVRSLPTIMHLIRERHSPHLLHCFWVCSREWSSTIQKFISMFDHKKCFCSQ